MKMDEIKNCCNIDLDEISRLKKLLSNSYDELECNKKTEIFKALSDPTGYKYCLYLNLGICMFVKSWLFWISPNPPYHIILTC